MIREHIRKTIQKFKMIEKGDVVFVAVSGGADSVSLLYLLIEMKDLLKLKLGILHINHQLRGKESARDEEFVRTLGKKLGLPVYIQRVNVKIRAKKEKISVEEAARSLRYEFFEKIADAKRVQKIALGHTQDDQAETVLMRIITGTGLQGLQAIRPKRKAGNVFFVRPLIEIPKREIIKFVAQEKIKFREDSSNRTLKYLRNKIRLKLIPALERSYNPKIKKVLARLPYLIDVDMGFLDEIAEISFKRLAQARGDGQIVFTKQSFLRLGPSIQYRLLARALRSLAGAELDFEHWNDFLTCLSTQKPFRLQLPKGIIAAVSVDRIRVYKGRQIAKNFSYFLNAGDDLCIPEISQTFFCERLKNKPKTVRKSDKRFEIFDAAKLSFPLAIRNRMPGDRFWPLGQSKPLKLKGFLINKRIPVEDRDRIPLIVSQDKIVWVAGVALGEEVKVGSNTKEFIRISCRRNTQS